MIFQDKAQKAIEPDKWTILVVEDDEGLNSLLRKNLERAGFTALGATTAEGALELFPTKSDILVILDYCLPEMDGIRFVEELTKREKAVPFLVLTGQGDERTAVEMMKLGARDYLVKEPSILEYLPESVEKVIRDIETERRLRLAERALVESEERYRALLQNLNEGVAVFNREGTLTYANPSAESIFGFETNSQLGKNTVEFLSESQIEAVKKQIEKSDNKSVSNIDLIISKPDGEPRDIIASVVMLPPSESRIEGYLVTFRDITERIQAQEKVKYLAKLVEGVSDAIISTDSDFNIASWNSAAEKLYGWKAEEVIGKPIGEVLKTEYPEKSEDEEFGEVNQLSKCGKKIFALPSVSFLRENGKETNGMVVVYHDITERRNAEIELKKSFEKLKQIFNSVVDIVGRIVEVRDPYTAGHERRVAKLSVAIAKKMGLTQDKIDAIRTSALVHDIGKIYVPSEILSKPGRLTKQEFDLIKAHPLKGYEILEAVEFPWPVSTIVLQHHERLDGSGYPNGLKSPEILTEAKILAVADVVEAMSSHRPYRPAPGVDAALEEVIQNRGKLFDPQVVDICLNLLRDNSFTF